MTDRNLTAAVVTVTEESQVYGEALFIELLTDTPGYAWTGVGPIVATMPGESSQTWVGLATIGEIADIAESADRRRNGVNMKLSGVDVSLLNMALTEDYQGKSAKIWQAYFDQNLAIIPDPTLLFAGTMDVLSAVDGSRQGSLSLDCESREQQLERTSRSLLTDQEQQRLYPGDLGLAFLNSLQSKPIIWGAKGQGDSASPNTGFGFGFGSGSSRFGGF